MKFFIQSGVQAALGLAMGVTLSLGAAEIGEDALNYEFGDSREPWSAISGEIRAAADDSAALGEWEEQLITVLEEGSLYSVDFACRELALIGSSRSVPALAKLLNQPKRSDMARYALQRIPGQEAAEALLDALSRAEGAERIGIINSLGERRDPAAVDALGPQVRSGDEGVARAAASALAKIGDVDASDALEEAMAAASSTLRPAIADAYLRSAERLLETGETEEAVAILEKLYDPAEDEALRAAALWGLVAAREDQALPLVLELLRGEDPLHHMAAHYVRRVPGTAATKAFADELGDLPVHGKQLLLEALGGRGDADAQPAVIEAVSDEEAVVRLAAIQALEGTGDASVVPLLANIISSGPDAERNAARRALAWIRGEGVDTTIVSVMEISTAPVQAELIRVLGERHATASVPALLTMAGADESSVRVEALRVLRDIADASHLEDLVELLVEATPGEERTHAENAVVEASRRGTAPEGRAAAVLVAIEDASDDSIRLSLVRVLGRIGESDALDALHAAVQDESSEVRDAAIRALADWPEDEPMATLEELAASEAESETHRVLALRGYIRMIGLPADRSVEERVALYERALEIAERPDEKILVISRLGDVESEKALELVRAHLDDEGLREAATVAVEKIEAAMQ
ncbi:MAG: HEAT repeat domain-containing protein [Opitutales bacterium]